LVKLTNPSKIPQNNKTNKNRKKYTTKQKILVWYNEAYSPTFRIASKFQAKSFVDHWISK
ncbi:MAG: hypothetical protein LBT09_02455, partial [Planctomycetaceae bacterium]|nr:hypothetical protein [Planctomycetaceae bacterium]